MTNIAAWPIKVTCPLAVASRLNRILRLFVAPTVMTPANDIGYLSVDAFALNSDVLYSDEPSSMSTSAA